MAPPTDLQLARLTCPFPPAALADLLLPQDKQLARARLRSILRAEPLLDLDIRPHLNQTQHLHRSLRLSKRLLELRDAHAWTPQDLRAAIALCDEPLPITLHESAFMSMIESQGTPEQKLLWLPKCRRYEYIGCYAQTELAHGSNVQGLLTTATFTPPSSSSSGTGTDTDTITISSGPANTVDGIKWWIGGAGVLATHALVQAILIISDPIGGNKQKSLGPHLFIVQLRDLTTHLPLPGIEIGDIGPKAYTGFSAIDNAYIRFHNVAIPRTNMLMGFSKLAQDGSYTAAIHDKISYGSMVALRAAIPENVGWTLAKAATTSIRYCIERRQFSSSKKGQEKESPVITYSSVKHRLYPVLATAYAYILAGQVFHANIYAPMLHRLTTQNDASLLAETHVLSTALKVATSAKGAEMVELARRSMGGHGFSWLGGVGTMYANLVPAQTYEGENHVVSMQVVRAVGKHLFGMLASCKKGNGGVLHEGSSYTLPQSTRYLRFVTIDGDANGGMGGFTFFPPQEEKKKKEEDTSYWLRPENIVHTLELRCAYLAAQIPTLLLLAQNTDTDTISSFAYDFTIAHATLWIVTTILTIPTPTHLQSLLTLYALSHLTDPSVATHLLLSRILTPEEFLGLRKTYESLIDGDGFGVGDLVGFTDAFGFEDWEVGVLGGREGGVYGRMWEEVRWREEEGGAGGGGERRRKLMRSLEGVTWEGLREEARRVVGHWKEGTRGSKL